MAHTQSVLLALCLCCALLSAPSPASAYCRKRVLVGHGAPCPNTHYMPGASTLEGDSPIGDCFQCCESVGLKSCGIYCAETDSDCASATAGAVFSLGIATLLESECGEPKFTCRSQPLDAGSSNGGSGGGSSLPVAAPGGSCGPNVAKCPGSQCCSQHGYCGVTGDHCGSGCQSGFGTCGGRKRMQRKLQL